MLSFRPRRWLVHLALAFGAGIFLGYRAAWHPLWLIGMALCALLAWLLRRQGRSVYLPCMALAVLLGMTRCGLALPTLPPEGAVEVNARVRGEAVVREKDGRVAVYLTDAALSGIDGRFDAYWTYWPKDENAPLPLDGQRVAFSGKLYHPMGQANPHGFDFRMDLLQKGVEIGLRGHCHGGTLPGPQQGEGEEKGQQEKDFLTHRPHTSAWTRSGVPGNDT